MRQYACTSCSENAFHLESMQLTVNEYLSKAINSIKSSSLIERRKKKTLIVNKVFYCVMFPRRLIKRTNVCVKLTDIDSYRLLENPFIVHVERQSDRSLIGCYCSMETYMSASLENR